MNLPEEIRELVAQVVLPKYVELWPDTWKRIDQATEAILVAVEASLPEEAKVENRTTIKNAELAVVGWNDCLAEVKAKLRSKE